MQKQIKQMYVESFPKNQSFRNEGTQSKSPPRSRRTFKTASFPVAIEKESAAAALSDTDQFLFQNLKSSFYRKKSEEDMAKIGRAASFQSRFIGSPPRSSSRVFVGEEASGGSSTADHDNSITILTYSKSPYPDFRQSMQEMVEARVASGGVVDRQFMEELLFRYLDLNSEKFYGCIIRAFLDLIVISREDSGRFSPRRRPWIGGRRRLKLDIKRVRQFCQEQIVPR